MPKKLNLSALKVKSFVTSLEPIEQNKAKGGQEPIESIVPCGTGTPCITCSTCTCPDYCTDIMVSCTCNTLDCTTECTVGCTTDCMTFDCTNDCGLVTTRCPVTPK
jgi:hypothetical protein